MNQGEFSERLIERGSIAVCVGCGGVGKTTLAAALALEGARRGRRTLVLTIDPARRLADALGLDSLGNEPQPLPTATLARLGVPPGGSLSALMLDMKRTFDDLVERFAESEAARERILENPIYRNVSQALAGSVEYSAMEKVYELWERGEHDLIVVDTPPAQHALDFLEAPQRLLEFLESRVVQMLIHPAMAAGRVGFRIFQHGTRRVLQLLERVSGLSFLEDVSEFLLAFEGMSAGFRERATKVRSLLTGPDSAFVLVTGAGSESVRQATLFRDRLAVTGAPLLGVLANRVRHWPEGELPVCLEPGSAVDRADLSALEDALTGVSDRTAPARELAEAAVAAARGYAALVRRDTRGLRTLREAATAAGRYWGEIPELAGDVSDLEALRQVALAAFGGEGETR